MPNTGEFPYSYPQSKFYFGPSKGYVCLFDFESATEEECIAIHHTWGHFFSDHKPATIVIMLNREKLGDELIPSSAAPQLGNGEYRGRIPFVEVWYPKPVPISAIDGYIVVVPKAVAGRQMFEQFLAERAREVEDSLNGVEEAWIEAQQVLQRSVR